MTTTTKLHCHKCGADWEPRKPDPIQCPRCKAVSWRTPRQPKPADKSVAQ